MRWEAEPEYPGNRAELEDYCDRLVTGLAQSLGGRLQGVLLCGSWARAEATPPTSDVDVLAVVDTVDDDVLDALELLFQEERLGTLNLVGADEVPAMARDALEMFSTNAKVLYGVNPFPQPNRQDLARDLARAAESLARTSRILALYPWLTETETLESLRQLTVAKQGLRWALRCLVAVRSGSFPKNWAETKSKLQKWEDGSEAIGCLDQVPLDSNDRTILVRRINRLAGSWLRGTAEPL